MEQSGSTRRPPACYADASPNGLWVDQSGRDRSGAPRTRVLRLGVSRSELVHRALECLVWYEVPRRTLGGWGHHPALAARRDVARHLIALAPVEHA